MNTASKLMLAAGALAAGTQLTALYAQQTPGLAADLAITIEPLASPAGDNSLEPQMTTGGGRTILSWLVRAGSRTSLQFAERTAAGWTPVTTAASGTDFMINSADVPSVRRLADGSLVAQWLQEDGPDPEAYKLRLARSSDQGRTWSTPVSPHRDKVQTQHGFASFFEPPAGGFGVVWLDGRAIDPDAPEGAGNMALRAATFDRAGKQLGEVVVDARVCECCQTAAASTTNGVLVAYRDRSTGEVRDIVVRRLVAGRWSEPTTAHDDGWTIKACPVNGPALAARGSEVAVAWFTGKGDVGHSFVVFSHDGGQTFGAPVGLDEGSSVGRVGVELLADGSAVATWVDGSGERPSFMARRVEATGRRGAVARIGESSGTRYPRVAQAAGEVLFAWTDTAGSSSSAVRVARAPIR